MLDPEFCKQRKLVYFRIICQASGYNKHIYTEQRSTSSMLPCEWTHSEGEKQAECSRGDTFMHLYNQQQLNKATG